MADVNTGGGSSKKKGNKPQAKKLSCRIDMTPMVDLMFLLITFFMLTTSMIKPQTMEISMPSKKKVDAQDETKVKASRAITVILGKNNKLFYYEGTQINGVDPKVQPTNYGPEGFRKYLIERNIDVMTKIRDLRKEREKTKMADTTFERKAAKLRADINAPTVIIKATNDASYKNLVDALDEMQICNISRYAIVDITPYDLGLIKDLNK